MFVSFWGDLKKIIFIDIYFLFVCFVVFSAFFFFCFYTSTPFLGSYMIYLSTAIIWLVCPGQRVSYQRLAS